jgi:hypothetical protein
METLDSHFPEDHEVLIVDLGSTENWRNILSRTPKIRTTILNVPYSGKFWKTKALNYAMKSAFTEYVTFMDVDCIFPKDFFLKASQEITKHPKTSYKVYNGAEATEGKIVGNSHFTMPLKTIQDMGGFDESYIGWGFEDWEFNMRYHRIYGDTFMFPGVELKHSNHVYSTWRSLEDELPNRARYEIAKEANFPDIVNPEHGEFENYLDATLVEKQITEQNKIEARDAKEQAEYEAKWLLDDSFETPHSYPNANNNIWIHNYSNKGDYPASYMDYQLYKIFCCKV